MTKYIGPDKGYAVESSKNATHKSMSRTLMEKKRQLSVNSFIAAKYKRRKPSYERAFRNSTHTCFEYSANHTVCDPNPTCVMSRPRDSTTPKPGFSSGHKSPKHLKHRWNSSKNLSRPEVGSYSNDLYIGGGLIILTLLSIFLGVHLFYKKQSKNAMLKSKESENKTEISTSELESIEKEGILPFPDVEDILKPHDFSESSLPVAQQLHWNDKIHLLLEKILPEVLYSTTHKQTIDMKNTVIEV